MFVVSHSIVFACHSIVSVSCLLLVGANFLYSSVRGNPTHFSKKRSSPSIHAIHPRHPRHPCHPWLTTNASSHCSRDIAPPPCMRSKIKLHGALAPQLSLICTHPNITHLIFSSRRTSIDSTRSRIVIPTGDLYRASCRYLG